MHTRRIRGFGATLVAGLVVLALLSSCGFQKFPEDRTYDVTPPDPPTNLQAVGGDQQVILTWTRSISRDVVDYVVFLRLDSATDWGTPLSVGNVGGIIIVGLTNGERYWARVQAEDASGNLSQPESAAEVQFNTIPDPPSGLTVTAVYQSGELQLQLTWTLSTSATTLGYTVEVSTDG
ncbi:MAG: hypothetical protein ACYS47_13960, partial [Planctomycetota bacterium]